jgi:hypothetical protein
MSTFIKAARQEIAQRFIMGKKEITSLNVNGKQVPGFEIFPANSRDQADILYHLDYFMPLVPKHYKGTWPPVSTSDVQHYSNWVKAHKEQNSASHMSKQEWIKELPSIAAGAGVVCNVATIAKFCTDSAQTDTGAASHQEKDSWFQSLKSNGKPDQNTVKMGVVQHHAGSSNHHSEAYDDDFDDDDDKGAASTVPGETKHAVETVDGQLAAWKTTDIVNDHDAGFDGQIGGGDTAIKAVKHLYDDDDVQGHTDSNGYGR